jgi:hypothetical protein
LWMAALRDRADDGVERSDQERLDLLPAHLGHDESIRPEALRP